MRRSLGKAVRYEGVDGESTSPEKGGAGREMLIIHISIGWREVLYRLPTLLSICLEFLTESLPIDDGKTCLLHHNTGIAPDIALLNDSFFRWFWYILLLACLTAVVNGPWDRAFLVNSSYR